MIKYFYIPGYFTSFSEICLLEELQQQSPQYFYEDRIIAGSYDLPQGLKWNGGRGGAYNWANLPYKASLTHKIMKYFSNKTNFSLLHTCTNLFIDTEDLLNDKICNEFLAYYYKPKDKVIIANPILKKYLHDKYPYISFVNSTTLGIIDINEVNKLSENEIYVVNYSKNNDNNYLMSLSNKDNLELICAEQCVPNCPNRQ